MSPWFYECAAGGASIVAGEAKIPMHASCPGTRFSQGGRVILPNSNYKVTFRARASRSLSIKVVLYSDVSLWVALSDPKTVSVSTTMQTISTTLTSNSIASGDGKARFRFWFDGLVESDIVTIDDVVLEYDSPAVVVTSLLENGGFESGQSPWGINGTATRVTSEAHSGTASFQHTNGGIWQNFTVSAGTTIQLSAWGKNVGGAQGIVGINFFSANFQTQLGAAETGVGGANTFQEATLTTTAPAGTAAATIWTYSDTGTFYVDDIVVTK